MTGSISLPIQGCLTIQRNTNMLKILKKVDFCRFYQFLCKNAVPRLSPELTFILQCNTCNILYINNIYNSKEALKKYSASGNNWHSSSYT